MVVESEREEPNTAMLSSSSSLNTPSLPLRLTVSRTDHANIYPTTPDNSPPPKPAAVPKCEPSLPECRKHGYIAPPP